MKKKEDDTKKEKNIQELETKEKGDKMEKINDQEKSNFDNINFSENALKKVRKFIADREGYSENAYQDTRGVWTIGYGHTKNVKQGDKITKEDAEKFFKEDLEEHIIPLNKVKVPLNDNQKAALASLIYNIGGTSFSNSSILKKLNEGDMEGAAEAFELYCKETKTVNINGENVRKKFTNQGLLNRRKKEKELFLTPTD